MLQNLPGWRLGLAVNLLFWLAAVALDFPRTYWDDSVIIGPAVSIAETGMLLNPYLTPRFYPGGTYLFYPPGFFWVLGGWIALFGKSVTSLALFWAACALVASVSLAVLLHRLSRSRIAWAVAPLLLFGSIAYTGHRYEMLAFASYFAGLALATGGHRRWGYLLLILTPTFAPTFLALCTLTVLTVFAYHWPGRFWGEMGGVAIGVVLATATLVAGVGGDIVGLFETMYGFRSVRIGFGGRDLISFRLVAAVLALNLATAAIWLALAGQGWRSLRFQLPLLLGAAMLLTLASHARPALIIAMNIATITLAALAIADALSAIHWRQLWLQKAANGMPAAGLACVAAILVMLNARYIATIALQPLDAGLVKTAQSALADLPADRLVVADARIVKEAQHFAANRRVEDAMIRDAWPNYQANFAALPPEESWIISRAALAASLDPTSVPVGADSLDTLFIAAGMGRTKNDSICLIDADSVSKIVPPDPRALLDAACRPASPS
jgi:hypothetical protein